MKKLLVGLLVLGSMSVCAQDPGIGLASTKFRAELEAKFKNIKSDMEIQISSRGLDFSDYELASKDLLTQIENAQKDFSRSMGEIEDFLSLYDEIKNSQSNRAMERLFEKKRSELSKLENEYVVSSSKLITLGEYLDIPLTSSYTSLDWNGYDWTKVAIGTVPFVLRDYYFKERMDVRYSNLGYSGKRKALKSRLTDSITEYARTKAKSIFEKCETQGCVYYLAEDVSLWLLSSQKMVSSLAIPVQGVENFKGPKFNKSSKIIRAVLDSMADNVATGLKTSF